MGKEKHKNEKLIVRLLEWILTHSWVGWTSRKSCRMVLLEAMLTTEKFPAVHPNFGILPACCVQTCCLIWQLTFQPPQRNIRIEKMNTTEKVSTLHVKRSFSAGCISTFWFLDPRVLYANWHILTHRRTQTHKAKVQTRARESVVCTWPTGILKNH